MSFREGLNSFWTDSRGVSVPSGSLFPVRPVATKLLLCHCGCRCSKPDSRSPDRAPSHRKRLLRGPHHLVNKSLPRVLEAGPAYAHYRWKDGFD